MRDPDLAVLIGWLIFILCVIAVKLWIIWLIVKALLKYLGS